MVKMLSGNNKKNTRFQLYARSRSCYSGVDSL